MDNTKIYKMDHNGDWVVVDWTTGEVEQLKKDQDGKVEQEDQEVEP